MQCSGYRFFVLLLQIVQSPGKNRCPHFGLDVEIHTEAAMQPEHNRAAAARPRGPTAPIPVSFAPEVDLARNDSQ
jgi:hypothetical protein